MIRSRESLNNLGPTDWRVGALLGLAVALGLLLLQIGEVTVADGASMLAVTHSILHHGSFDVPASLGAVGTGGKYYSNYGIGLSVVALPFVAIGDLVAVAIGHQAQLESFGASSVMPIIMGLLVFTLWRIAIRLGATMRWAAVLAAGAVLGTYALPYGKDFFSEPLTALGIAIALERLLASRYRTAGLGLALAVVTRPQTVLLVPVISLIVWRYRGFRPALDFALVAAVGVVVDALYNVVRFGSVLNSGYGGESFSTPFLRGAVGLLFGTNKSLFLFAPVAVVLVVGAVTTWRRGDRFYVTLAGASFVVFFVSSALWWSWQGGWSWGPRLILPGVLCAMPLLAPISRAWQRIALALLVLGFAVSASTLLVPTESQQLDRPPPINGPSAVRQYELIPSVVRYSADHLRAAHAAGISRRYLNLWQVNLDRELGRKGLAIGIVGSLLLLAALVGTLFGLRRRLSDLPGAGLPETGSESLAMLPA
jgi:hypothetical protein